MIDSKEYYLSLPKKRMAAAAIFRNRKEEILILKTSYKEHYELPGGVVEENESPVEAAIRECKEEIGIDAKIKRCLVIHYRSALENQNENIMFTFDAGVIENETMIRPDGKEIIEAKFVTPEKAKELLGKRISSRWLFVLQALKEGKTFYLESIDKLEASSY